MTSTLSLPFVPGSETSRAAAESMRRPAETLREKVHRALLASGMRGMTDDEIEVELGLSHQTASARRRELVQTGFAFATTRKRPTRSGRAARVWMGRTEPAPRPDKVQPKRPSSAAQNRVLDRMGKLWIWARKNNPNFNPTDEEIAEFTACGLYWRSKTTGSRGQGG